MLGVAAQRIVHAIRKPCNNADEAIAAKPEGTGLAGRSAVSRRSPMGPTIGFASLRASHPGKPPSRPRGAYAEVPLPCFAPCRAQTADADRHHVNAAEIVDPIAGPTASLHREPSRVRSK